MLKEFKSLRFKKFKLIIIIFVLIIFSGYTLYPTRYSLISIAYAGIKGTKHDLSVTGGGSIKATSETQICIFCHTPHNSSTAGPLWNHTLSSATYTVPTTSTFPSLLSSVGQPDKGAKLCLSCHDGTVAVGSVLHMSGGAPGTISLSGVTGGGMMPSSDVDYIGTNISGSHPVSIAYNDNLYNDKITQCNNGLTAFTLLPPASVVLPVALKPTNNTYGGQGGYLGRGVQCASCHDPHNDTYVNFLVMSFDGSNMCYNCHQDCVPQ